jgi:hypothetical protein
MKTLRKIPNVSLLLTLFLAILLAAPATATAALPTVDLGTTSSFAVLAGSTITNTGPTTITGDVGLHPGTAFTGQSSVTLNGALHLADAVALQAKNDLVTAYNDAAGRTPVTRIATELGGKTLKSGVYDSADGTFEITGTLTLDAEGDPNAVFVFKTASTLITASGSGVSLLNGARFCRILEGRKLRDFGNRLSLCGTHLRLRVHHGDYRCDGAGTVVGNDRRGHARHQYHH